MAPPAETVSVLMALEYVVMASIVLLLVPLSVAVPLVPLLLIFAIALYLYRSG